MTGIKPALSAWEIDIGRRCRPFPSVARYPWVPPQHHDRPWVTARWQHAAAPDRCRRHRFVQIRTPGRPVEGGHPSLAVTGEELIPYPSVPLASLAAGVVPDRTVQLAPRPGTCRFA